MVPYKRYLFPNILIFVSLRHKHLESKSNALRLNSSCLRHESAQDSTSAAGLVIELRSTFNVLIRSPEVVMNKHLRPDRAARSQRRDVFGLHHQPELLEEKRPEIALS